MNVNVCYTYYKWHLVILQQVKAVTEVAVQYHYHLYGWITDEQLEQAYGLDISMNIATLLILPVGDNY